MAETKKYARRGKDELIAEIDQKIERHKNNIETLEKKKAAILNRKTNPNTKLKKVMGKVKDLGLSAEEIAEKLGITLDE